MSAGAEPPRAQEGHGIVAGICVVFAVAFVLLGIGSPLVGARVFHATQLLQLATPWQEQVATGAPIGNACISDTVDAVLPQRVEGVNALKHGEISGYDNKEAGGSSSVYGQDAGLFNPVTLGPFLLLPHWLAPAYVKLLEMVVCLLGTFLFLRRLGLSPPAGIVGGLIYTSSGFMVVWTNWPQTTVAAFAPMLFWTVERLVQKPDLRSALLVPLPLTCMILGGFPSVTGWALYAAVLYFLMRLAFGRFPVVAVARAVAYGAGGLVMAAALSAFQLLPFLRVYNATNFGYRSNYDTAHLPANALLTAAFPHAFGSCGTATAYFGTSSQVEASVFIGSAALVLVVAGLTGRARPGSPFGVRAFFLVAGLFCTLLAFHGGHALKLTAHLPIFSSNLVTRIRFLIGLCAAVLAGFGLDRLLAGATVRRRLVPMLAAGVVWLAAAALGVEAAIHVHRDDRTAGFAAQLDRGTEWAVAAGVVTAGLVALALWVPRARSIAAVLVVAIVAVQGYSFAHPFWPREPRSAFYPQTPTHAFLDAQLGHDRYAADGLTMWPGTGVYYDQRSVTGHALPDQGYSDLLKALDPKVFVTPTFTELSAAPAVVTSPLLDRLGASWFVASPTDPVIGTAAVTGQSGAGVQLADGASVTAPAGSAPLRAVGVTLTAPLGTKLDDRASLSVVVTDAAGTVLSQGSRLLGVGAEDGVFSVPVVQTAGGQPQLARITLHDRGASATLDGDATPMLTLVTAADDGLRLAFDNGSVVYQRLDALPRIRWASAVTDIASPAAQVSALAGGKLPGDTVVLAGGGNASGQPATMAVPVDANEHIRVQVAAQGAGYVVVADSLGAGWHASVDGHPAALVVADHAFGAVAVSAGVHTVDLRYVRPDNGVSILITLLAVLAYAVLSLVAWSGFDPRAPLRGRARRQVPAGPLA